MLTGAVGSYFVLGSIPLGLALSARGVVNSLVDLLNNRADNHRLLLLWLTLGLFFTILDALSRFSLKFFIERLRDELNLKVTSEILIHADSLELSCFEDPRFQDILARARQDSAHHFAQFITTTLSAITNLFQSLSLIGLLVVIDPLIVLFILPVAIPYLIYQWRLSKTRFQLEHSRATKHRWTQYFVDRLTSHESVPEVTLLGLGPYFIKKFQSLMTEFRDQDRNLYIRNLLINMTFAFITTIAAYAVFTRVAFRVLKGGLTIGDVAIFGGASIRLRTSIENAILDFTSALEQMLYISNLLDFFSIKPQFSKEGGSAFPSARGEVKVKGVTFTYPGSTVPALKDISLHVKPGETVALVGENGAGKTTLVKLIGRLYDPDQGVVLFDGYDVRTLSLEYLHSQLSFVFQSFGRYEATISENIIYGDWKKLLDDRKRVEEIASLVGINNMIVRMPKGYDTMLGRSFGEFTLSMGQWQQIALARAFARDATLLILDEPTSNLDARSEYDLYCRFKQIAKGKTTILVSHLFSTVNMADRIIVLDKGQIIEQGTHEDLLAENGHYASLYRLHQRQMKMPVSA